jgi:hypothetical protein
VKAERRRGASYVERDRDRERVRERERPRLLELKAYSTGVAVPRRGAREMWGSEPAETHLHRSLGHQASFYSLALPPSVCRQAKAAMTCSISLLFTRKLWTRDDPQLQSTGLCSKRIIIHRLTSFYSAHAAPADCLWSSLTLLQLTMSNH